MGRDFVQKYIDRIFVTVDNDKIQLQIKLFTSESTMRYLEKLERRSGHTFKKMCPVHTSSFERDCRTAVGHCVRILYTAEWT